MSDEEKEGQASNAVPYDRFQTVNEQRKEYQSKVADLTSQLAALEKQAGAADALFTQLEQVNATLESERQSWAQERSLMGAGLLDQEARDLAVWSYNRLDPESRPPLNEWLEGMKGEDATVPPYLQPYFKPAAPPAPAPTPTMPDTNRGAVPSGIETGTHKPGQIAGMTAEEYKQHRDQIMQRYYGKK